MQRTSFVAVSCRRSVLLPPAAIRAAAPLAARHYAELGGQLNKEYESYIRKERAQQRELEGGNPHNVQGEAKDNEPLRSHEDKKSSDPVSGGRQEGRYQPPEKVLDPKQHDTPLY